ncbi:MAG: glycosyltransferase family 2 protein [Ruminiclostridium sp.]
MEKVLVSIIVPIYNVEKYVAECVKSCQKQTMKEIEIICVDDGSTDNSFAIVKAMAEKDPRIKCITKKNAGYGNTMNIGIDNVKGEYFIIAESDDYIEPDMCEFLYKTAVKNNLKLDVVKSDYLTFTTENGKQNTQYEPTCTDKSFYNKVLFPKKDKEIFLFQMNTWTGIYRTDFIRENNIRHNETPGASYQDNGFWFQTLTLAKSVKFVDRAFYHYRQDNPNSSINSKGKVFCMNEEYEFIHDFMMKHEEVKNNFMFEFFRKRFFNYMHTYSRIAEEYRLPFLERFSKELYDTQKSGEINISKIQDKWLSNMASRIMDDYRLFYYEDTTYRLENELKNARERLDILSNSKEFVKGKSITDRIKKFIRK